MLKEHEFTYEDLQSGDLIVSDFAVSLVASIEHKIGGTHVCWFHNVSGTSCIMEQEHSLSLIALCDWARAVVKWNGSYVLFE